MTPEQIKQARLRAYSVIEGVSTPKVQNCRDVLALANEIDSLKREIANLQPKKGTLPPGFDALFGNLRKHEK